MVYFRSPDSNSRTSRQRMAKTVVYTESNEAIEAVSGPFRRSVTLGKRSIVNKWKSPLFVLAFILLASTFTSLHAQSAQKWNKIGLAAEAREDFDAAYDAYRHAHEAKPADLAYKTSYERVRFQASTSHVDRGRVLRQNGDVNGALAEFNRALEIDGGNQAAAQEAETTRKMISSAPAAQADLSDMAVRPPSNAAGPITLQPVSHDPITLHTVADTKEIYQALGKLAGLNVIFDPDYTSKRIQVDLTDTTLYDALRIMGALSGTFWKPVTANTIFVAQNTRTRRTDLDPMAVQTFYLSNVSQAADATEVLTALRNIFDQTTKVFLVPSQNAIVMRATPDQLALAQDLLNNLDRTKPEVVVDIAVLEVNKTYEQKLGITLPQSFSITPQLNTTTTTTTGTTTTTSTTTSTTTTTTTTTSSSLTLSNLAHLNGSNFAVGIGAATVDALLTNGDTRVLQNPRVRATDGQKAQLKIGSRIPVATGSYNSGVSGGVGGIGVQTQFTYLDIGVVMEMTPTVHLDREISLKMKIEVTTQSGTVNISGVQEPVIGQRSVEQVIQLKDGEPSILAGLLNVADSLTVGGTPGLGQVPILNRIFSSRDKTTSRDEIVFLMIPHIVRQPVLTRMNTRAIDTGTGQGIELRRAEVSDDGATVDGIPLPAGITAKPLTPTTAAAAAAALVGQSKTSDVAAAAAAMIGQTKTSPAADAASALASTSAPLNQQAQGPPVTYTVVPPVGPQTPGSTFQVAITSANAHDLYSVPLQLQFNPQVLSLVNVDAGDMLGHDGQAVAVVHRDEGNGSVAVSMSRPPGVRGVDGQGQICILTFKANASGDSTVSLTKVGAKNSAQTSMPAVGSQAVVHVK